MAGLGAGGGAGFASARGLQARGARGAGAGEGGERGSPEPTKEGGTAVHQNLKRPRKYEAAGIPVAVRTYQVMEAERKADVHVPRDIEQHAALERHRKIIEEAVERPGQTTSDERNHHVSRLEVEPERQVQALRVALIAMSEADVKGRVEHQAP